MGQKLHNRIDAWKKQLLDFGKRNRLINFLEGKRNNVKITSPSCDDLYELLVTSEQDIVFPYARTIQFDDEGEEVYETIIRGNVETNKTHAELQKTLKSLRYKANTSIEEQGINTLYLTFGMLKWKEQDNSNQTFASPIILVPVRLLIESLTSPYKLSLHDDEIVINPTLSHKLDNDFGIKIPEYDATHDLPKDYLNKLAKLIENKGWTVEKTIFLSNLSFLKINMYRDLERNEQKLNANPVIASLVGERDPIEVSAELNNFNHDKEIRPIDTFQVVDADSSQQDAILLSKKGVSFVLQGPPGTGKSQTITNIIAEAIADGKKVLFVSEKMAALQVVYNRLASVGLGDFCFTLHSHKAKKKEILRDLESSINIDRTRVREEALSQLELLERKRNTLNQYQEELHTQTSGLNMSIFQINGRLAKLEDVPDVIFAIPNVDSTTPELLSERIYILGEYAKTIGKRSEDYENNVWRNSTIKYLSNELRHDIDSYSQQYMADIKALENGCLECSEKLSISKACSLNEIEDLLSLLEIVSRSPIFPSSWVKNKDLDALLNNALEYKKKTEYILETQRDIANKYNAPFFDIDANIVKTTLCSAIDKLCKSSINNDKAWLAENIGDIYHAFAEKYQVLFTAYEKASSVAELLGVDIPETISQLEWFNHRIEALTRTNGIKPLELWFDENVLHQIKSEIAIHKSLHNAINDSKRSLLNVFDEDILEWNYYPVLQRFRGEYSSVFRVFNSNYKKDLNVIKGYLLQGGKFSYSEALSLLTSLKSISDKEKALKDKAHVYHKFYGAYYNGLNTNWEIIEDALDKFEGVLSEIQPFVGKLKNKIIFNSLPYEELLAYTISIADMPINDARSYVETTFSAGVSAKSTFKELSQFMDSFCSTSEAFISAYDELQSLRNGRCEYSELISDLEEAISLTEIKKELTQKKKDICSQYESYYKETETDWDELIAALNYAAEFKEAISLYNLPSSFIKSACENIEFVSFAQNVLPEMTASYKAAQQGVEWFSSLFIPSEDFYKQNILDIADRMVLCSAHKHLLEEWVDYCENRNKCNEAGLNEFIKEIERMSLNENQIIDAYLKRFYRLWLDAILPQFPAVLNFRSRKQSQTIYEFSELDKAQFKIAQARVRERAISRIPDFNSINAARDEIAILKRELNKQRRLMPLRKLFMAIPNLITSLRPCFMMSPLSVSVFLEAQTYDFDMVIFDEASQVHTEDAIGAIMRGKQVIIVGDTKQLPPTSFFSTTLVDEDFDIDSDESEDYKEAGAYESILDEAVAVLPERSLRWHYRSRHEHLIAFSNIKIYNGQLITFPSSTEKAKDCGVEYIHVANGVYDRGGKKNNIVEAQKVADLVFEHFKLHPNRSLGVVTFSEAQQSAVEMAIRQKRLNDNRFERFFIEDKEEPFFIKNLENVQGDERDTIIFSIGYAKDSKGIMYMNFGPLSRDGGYRRLNVAITRAKHNVKLVGSIVPTDIDLDKVSSEGVKMLRSYIEFAQEGIVALEKELSFNYSLDFDSPFEEAVYDFLQSKGYNVVTQVGCSGFRIDMAVKHPTNSGQFAIGIECDGATYHSSRTARERDRLRQSVLEDMGWTIYRIWSTDWIKNQNIEKEKLVDAVEKALGNSSKENVVSEEIPEYDEILQPIEIEEHIEASEVVEKGFGFDIYRRYDSSMLLNDIKSGKRDYQIAVEIISMEQPIHFEELCRRIAPIYGRQKVTSVVRDEVEYLFRHQLRGQVVRDKSDFVKLCNFNGTQVRIPDPNDDYLRPITYICEDELSLAMKIIAEHSFGITPDNLFIETAREFGYKRTGENIITALRTAYNAMLKNNEIAEVDGKVKIIN